jgi:hypothetical protein
LSLGSSPTSTSFDTITLSHTYTRTKSHTYVLSPPASSIASGVATSAGYVKPTTGGPAPANTSIAGPVPFLGAGSNVQVTLSTLSLALLCMIAIM